MPKEEEEAKKKKEEKEKEEKDEVDLVDLSDDDGEGGATKKSAAASSGSGISSYKLRLLLLVDDVSGRLNDELKAEIGESLLCKTEGGRDLC